MTKYERTLPPPDPTGGKRTFDLSPLGISPEQAQKIENGRSAFLFGAFMDPMIGAGLRHVSDGSMKPQDVSLALQTIAYLYAASGRDYESQPAHLTDQALLDHQYQIIHVGNPQNDVPARFEMSFENRIAQLKRADETFSELPPEIQALIAELNYEALFRPSSMADARLTRERGGDVERVVTSRGNEAAAMNHLTLTNLSIGEISRGIVEFATKQDKKAIIIDTGSGTGGALSATLSELAELVKSDRLPNGFAVIGIETTQGFFTRLEEFAKNDEVITEDLGLQVRTLSKDSEESLSQEGTLTIVKSDTLSGLRKIRQQGFGPDDLVVITGNYSWHRLDSRRKKEIMDLYKDVPNVIFLIGDFANHGSPAAKRYFCLGANGPLNDGNLDLTEQFREVGYSLVDLGSQRPQSLDPRFAERIVQDDMDPNSDGHLWIAYRGDLARESIQLKAA